MGSCSFNSSPARKRANTSCIDQVPRSRLSQRETPSVSCACTVLDSSYLARPLVQTQHDMASSLSVLVRGSCGRRRMISFVPLILHRRSLARSLTRYRITFASGNVPPSRLWYNDEEMTDLLYEYSMWQILHRVDDFFTNMSEEHKYKL